MLRKVLVLVLLLGTLSSCASWFGGSNTPDADNPTVGSKDGSNQLFDTGPSSDASAPVSASPTRAIASAPSAN